MENNITWVTNEIGLKFGFKEGKEFPKSPIEGTCFKSIPYEQQLQTKLYHVRRQIEQQEAVERVVDEFNSGPAVYGINNERVIASIKEKDIKEVCKIFQQNRD